MCNRLPFVYLSLIRTEYSPQKLFVRVEFCIGINRKIGRTLKVGVSPISHCLMNQNILSGELETPKERKAKLLLVGRAPTFRTEIQLRFPMGDATSK